MSDAKLSWLVKSFNDTTYQDTDDYYAGTHTPKENLHLVIQLWNNRAGTTRAGSMSNFAIKVTFMNDEDKYLLKYLKAANSDGNALTVEQYVDHAIIVPDASTLSGSINNGVPSENADNFYEFQLIFSPPDTAQLKENDLKNMFLQVVER